MNKEFQQWVSDKNQEGYQIDDQEQLDALSDCITDMFLDGSFSDENLWEHISFHIEEF